MSATAVKRASFDVVCRTATSQSICTKDTIGSAHARRSRKKRDWFDDGWREFDNSSRAGRLTMRAPTMLQRCCSDRFNLDFRPAPSISHPLNSSLRSTRSSTKRAIPSATPAAGNRSLLKLRHLENRRRPLSRENNASSLVLGRTLWNSIYEGSKRASTRIPTANNSLHELESTSNRSTSSIISGARPGGSS